MAAYQPKTGARCSCKRGVWRDNCPTCEGTGWVIDFQAIRAHRKQATTYEVHEGRPSWHQQRAGHISAAATVGFKSREAAEEFAEGLRRHHPGMPVFVLQREGSK